MDFTLPIYDKYRKYIKESRENNKSWDDLKNGRIGNSGSLENFLSQMHDFMYWDIEINEWLTLVNLEKEAEERSKELEEVGGSAILVNDQSVSDIRIPELPNSAWQKYRNRLKKNGFRENSIAEIESSTLKILKMLQRDSKEARKGLVMGNVQSGKTANMAALMAMSADWGWNMFIILSGTIENLRIQTQNRLLEDLGRDNSTINWRGIEKPTNHSETDKTSDLSFSQGSANFTVCLKNKKRLENLIDWLQYDQKKKSQMKVIVIDDEADQAGVNTADVTSEERKTINRLIVNLVGDQKKDGTKTDRRLSAMNYIGYTATPYANFLNETSEDSLYPKNFIATLSNPPEYFGPQVLFGIEGMGDGDNPSKYDGLDIIRNVTNDDVAQIKLMHEGDAYGIPLSLKKSIAWFLASTAALRYRGFKKPLSMLVHTSHKQEHHRYIAESIERWIMKSHEDVLYWCKKIYNEEKERLTKEKFIEYRPEYPNHSSISTYPDYENFSGHLDVLISKITHIPLNDENELDYQETIHLCIDNCANNGIDDEGMFKRLVYPNSDVLGELNSAPAFIVVGGATLSRGLTLEGLISTYFLRTGKQADTLMQMGRWFGYRRGYELYPRIWLTENTYNQFRFLSTLDYELRDEIKDMELRGVQPKEYGPRIKNTPKLKFIRITAKNKMQSSQYTDLDYSGSHNQTVIFENDYQKLKDNISLTDKFLSNLGEPEYSNDNAALIWRDIDYRIIFEDYLMKFEFASNNIVFSNIESLYEWVDQISQEEKIDDWNVVVAGLKQNKDENLRWKIGGYYITKISRTRRKTSGRKFDIGVLRAPKDLLLDIQYEKLSQSQKEHLARLKDTDYYEKRRIGGLEKTPQLLIYRINRDSKVNTVDRNTNNSMRTDLEAKEDVIGICITIPGARRSSNFAKTVTVKIDPSFANDDYENIEEGE